MRRLKQIERLCGQSSFFSTHEIIGSSLLFVNDDSKASVWMIDFEKTRKYEGEQKLEHNTAWVNIVLVDNIFIIEKYLTLRN